MPKANVEPRRYYLNNYGMLLSETCLQWWIYKEGLKMLQNIDIVLRNLYLHKFVGYFHYQFC